MKQTPMKRAYAAFRKDSHITPLQEKQLKELSQKIKTDAENKNDYD